MDIVLDKVQVDFREGFGTTDHIFSLQALINKYTSAKKGRLYTPFIDIKGAFDNVCRFLLIESLSEIGLPIPFALVLVKCIGLLEWL